MNKILLVVEKMLKFDINKVDIDVLTNHLNFSKDKFESGHLTKIPATNF